MPLRSVVATPCRAALRRVASRWAQRALRLAAAAALAAAPAAAGAQGGRAVGGVTATTPFASRAQLQAALSGAEGRGATTDATILRRRLADGDFRAGDRLAVTLTLDSTSQQELVVRDSQRVDLPPLGSLSLRGVLRSEAQPALLAFFRRYYRNPVVRVQPLVRVGFTGAVQRPGFFSVPPDAPLTDALAGTFAVPTTAGPGGPNGNADLAKIEVYRGAKRVVDRKQYQRAARDGLTLADLGVVSGDEVRVPERKNRSTAQVIQNVFFGVSALTSVIFLIRAFYNS